MAIVSTTDVCQNVDSTREIPKHGTALVYVTKDGTTYVIDDYVANTPAFTTVETTLTGKFDETGYYVTGDTVDGGSP